MPMVWYGTVWYGTYHTTMAQLTILICCQVGTTTTSTALGKAGLSAKYVWTPPAGNWSVICSIKDTYGATATTQRQVIAEETALTTAVSASLLAKMNTRSAEGDIDGLMSTAQTYATALNVVATPPPPPPPLLTQGQSSAAEEEAAAVVADAVAAAAAEAEQAAAAARTSQREQIIRAVAAQSETASVTALDIKLKSQTVMSIVQAPNELSTMTLDTGTRLIASMAHSSRQVGFEADSSTPLIVTDCHRLSPIVIDCH